MLSALRSRALLLVVCAAIGVGLALAGTSVGATDSITTDSAGPEFVVADENVTFQHADGHETVVQNVSDLERIEFERVDDTFQIRTERVQPLTETERETALTVARDNASVRQAMAKLGDYEMTVEPIRKLTASENISMNATPADEYDGDATFENATAETFVIEGSRDGTVTVDRDPDYVEDEAVVGIADVNTDTEYSVVIDLETETVIDGIDWESE